MIARIYCCFFFIRATTRLDYHGKATQGTQEGIRVRGVDVYYVSSPLIILIVSCQSCQQGHVNKPTSAAFVLFVSWTLDVYNNPSMHCLFTSYIYLTSIEQCQHSFSRSSSIDPQIPIITPTPSNTYANTHVSPISFIKPHPPHSHPLPRIPIQPANLQVPSYN